MTPPRLLPAAAVAAVLALAACTGDRPVRVLQADGTEVLVSVANRSASPARTSTAAPAVRETPVPVAPARTQPAPEPVTTPAAAAPAEAASPAPREEQVAALPRPVLDAKAIAAAPDPAGFVGKAPAVVQTAFGDATLRRREPPAEVWQYRTGACVLDLVFYPEGTAGALQVAHVALRPVDAPAIDGKTCAAHVRARTPGRD
ncbi:hypothetical protein [Caenispirillum bisanense]|uniref:Lipoprotein n=1 Tax=Caenispirillum bisanense TaxID=414052 RepID=A0A286GA18_9PROT|nr:hypothetical protein [Caenispirillum bisanense]SOD92375.1 hypothetical protein SAMN05421508_102403 [Caenispirillum bisanense]